MTTTPRVRKGQLGWAHHPRGGIIVDRVGELSPMPSPYETERKLGPYGMSKSLVCHLDTLPKGEELYSIGREARIILGIPDIPKQTDPVVEAWERLKAR